MIVLREMTKDDCEKVHEIAQETLPECWSYKEFCNVLQYDYDIYHVAWETTKREVVGFAGAMVIAEEAELLNIAVAPDTQSCGIGRMLLERLLLETLRYGAKRMFLEVRRSNYRARELYKSLGFRETGVRKNYYTNPSEDAVIMTRSMEK